MLIPLTLPWHESGGGGGGGGGYDAYLEQLVLSPTVEEAAPTQVRDETRGKKRAEAEESNTSKLLILMKEMRDGMRGKDEKLKDEIRWRDNHLDEQNKKRENFHK